MNQGSHAKERTASHARGGDDRPLAAIALVVFSLVLFTAMDAISKILVAEYSAIEVTWVRYLVNMVLLLPFALRHPRAPLSTSQMGLQMTRGVVMVSSSVAFMSGLAYLPMADATAIAFATPLLVTAFSIPLLGERVGPRRWAAVAVGFLGVLLIVQPGTAAFHWAAIYPLLSSACFASGLIITRRLSMSEPPITTLLYTTGVACIAMTLFLPWVWQPMTLRALVMAGAMGVLSTVGQYLLVLGYQRGPASLLAPFSYSQIIWSTIWGAFIFHNMPGTFTWAGAAVVIASGLYVFHRERVVVGARTASGAAASEAPGQ